MNQKFKVTTNQSIKQNFNQDASGVYQIDVDVEIVEIDADIKINLLCKVIDITVSDTAQVTAGDVCGIVEGYDHAIIDVANVVDYICTLDSSVVTAKDVGAVYANDNSRVIISGDVLGEAKSYDASEIKVRSVAGEAVGNITSLF